MGSRLESSEVSATHSYLLYFFYEYSHSRRGQIWRPSSQFHQLDSNYECGGNLIQVAFGSGPCSATSSLINNFLQLTVWNATAINYSNQNAEKYLHALQTLSRGQVRRGAD